MKYTSHSLEETENIAGDIASQVAQMKHEGKATIVALSGDLGAGKTTFMKYFAKAFGVAEEIQSPTFIIMRIFACPEGFEGRQKTFKKLIHIDAYRLEKEEELLHLGWEELVGHEDNLICIEWPEKVPGIMPEHSVIRFGHGERENERTIETDFGAA